jgi:hypothetical protein
VYSWLDNLSNASADSRVVSSQRSISNSQTTGDPGQLFELNFVLDNSEQTCSIYDERTFNVRSGEGDRSSKSHTL